MDSLFRPPAERWLRVDPAYAKVRAVSALISCLVIWGGLTAAAWLFLDYRYGLGVLAAGLSWTVWRVVRAVRYAHSWGYAERDQDLCITRGLWFKDLTVVPYGRMQLAKVESGPVLRAFGLANVTLVTASAQSQAQIPGLRADEAARLRDRLIEVGDSLGAGM